MIKFSACIEMLFADHGDFYARFAPARAAGLSAVEFWNWSNKDLARVADLAAQNGLLLAACCVDTADPDTQADFYSKRLVDESGQGAFLRALEDSITVAQRLSIPTLILTVGQERNDISRYAQHASIVRALRRAAPILKGTGIRLAVEPLNVTVNHRGYYLYSAYEAFAIADEVDEPEIGLLYDIYHQQLTDGNLIANLTGHIAKIHHIHVADVPGRHEPGTGEINYQNVFAALSAAGYPYWVGLEYSPTVASEVTIDRLYAIAGDAAARP